MHESDFYQYWGEQAARERALEDILQVLEIRLQPEVAQRFKPNLESIEDLQHLCSLKLHNGSNRIWKASKICSTSASCYVPRPWQIPRTTSGKF